MRWAYSANPQHHIQLVERTVEITHDEDNDDKAEKHPSITATYLILFTNIFFISSRAAGQDLTEDCKNGIDLRVADTSRKML